MRVSELTDLALDWAVAKCEGGDCLWYDTIATHWMTLNGKDIALSKGWAQSFTPSTNWEHGGPIIERERIAMSSKPDGLWAAYAPKGTRLVQHGGQAVEIFNWYFKQEGYTPLVAAMRCYVASKLGDEVEIPAELLTKEKFNKEEPTLTHRR